jgi:FkbM family methyltransferase
MTMSDVPHAAADRAALVRLRTLGWTPRVVFDVGASNGSWSDAIATVCPDAEYHLFEPLAGQVPMYRDGLSAVLAQHPGFALHAVALGDRTGEVIVHHLPNPYASTILPMEGSELGAQEVRVPLTTVDELVGTGGLPCPNLLKADTQGGEFAILLGTQRVLGSIDVVLLETWVWRTYEGKAPLLLEIASWLAQRGFFLWDIADTYRDDADVLASIDCFFVNAQSMAPYLQREYRADVGEVDTGERARLLGEIARLRAELQRATEGVGLRSRMSRWLRR